MFRWWQISIITIRNDDKIQNLSWTKIINSNKTFVFEIHHNTLFLQECSLMFFQKNISEDLELNKRLKVSISICYIIFNFFILAFIFYLSIYYSLHRSCALTICLSYHYTYLSIVFSFLEKSYTHSLIYKT